MACALCGTEDKPAVTVEREGKSIDLCYECKKAANIAFNGVNVPIVWVGVEDISNRYENADDEEDWKYKEALNLTYDDIDDIAETMSSWFWNGNANSEWFSDSVCEAFEEHLKEKEANRIREAPKEELPLMMENLRYPKENKKVLEEALKKK